MAQRIRFFILVVFLLFIGGCASSPVDNKREPAISAEILEARYKSAERFLPWNIGKYVKNASVQHHWIGNTDRFWYAQETDTGKDYILVDARTGKKQPAFDQTSLAYLLSEASGKTVDRNHLNVTSLNINDIEAVVVLNLGGESWSCAVDEKKCALKNIPSKRPGELVSPDGKWALFRQDHNIWLRSLTNGTVKQLTEDGQEHFGYGNMAGSSTMKVTFQRMKITPTPIAIWSPDSTKIITHRLDERKVQDLHLIQYAPESGSARPALHSFRYAFPGDEHIPTAELVILNIKGDKTTVDYPALDVVLFTPILDSRVWWDDAGNKVFVAPRELYQKRQRLLAVDALSGAVEILVEEKNKTYVDSSAEGFAAPTIQVLSTGDIIWYSERDGWGHLYRYDGKGAFLNQITQGNWQVRSIVRIDETLGQIYFIAGGREKGVDPYFEHLYVVNMDGSGLKLLTPEPANHDINFSATSYLREMAFGSSDPAEAAFSSSGNYFISAYSRPDLPSTTVLRDIEGHVITSLAKADISALNSGSLSMPEPFSVRAADGKTRIYGTIYRPSNFDSTKKYPVIDAVYPGPHDKRTPKSFMGAISDTAQSIAEVGFIVVTIDGRGTPFRSKAFHDISYGRLDLAGNLEDHLAGFKQLAEWYPSMDLDRVGIYGHSGGGTASARAILAHPDFYKVAVASAGAHDKRGYVLAMGGLYQGPYSDKLYEGQVTSRLAGNLKGKLLLAHGDMDDNVNPAQTMQLVDALVKANKDFDLLILPNASHNFAGVETYFSRRRWDYFVEHLMGETPPKNYQISGPN